jgi:hypothetical protein
MRKAKKKREAVPRTEEQVEKEESSSHYHREQLSLPQRTKAKRKTTAVDTTEVPG